MTYANQLEGLKLLPGEDSRLIFTETDRHLAYKDLKGYTNYSIFRLYDLATQGGSSQAAHLVEKVAKSSEDLSPLLTELGQQMLRELFPIPVIDTQVLIA